MRRLGLTDTAFVAIAGEATPPPPPTSTYQVYVANRALVAANQMEFDVFIQNDPYTLSWGIRSFQCGYQFSSDFVNGGTLSGAYVAGSSGFGASFGKTFGFSWNATNRVLNQSANTGSVCPGGLVTTTPTKIARFRVTNTVAFPSEPVDGPFFAPEQRAGVDDGLLMVTTPGVGYIAFSASKYNTLDCSNPGSTIVTGDGTVSTTGPSTQFIATVTVIGCAPGATAVASATGGLPPYTGTGNYGPYQFAGSYTISISDSRVSLFPSASVFNC